jgi:DNA-binding MarR family transcriptional regulator
MKSLNDLRTVANRLREAEKALDDLRQTRDEVIREVRRQTNHTVSEIAEAAGVSLATAKSVLRGIR